jgi:hypothetical protein
MGQERCSFGTGVKRCGIYVEPSSHQLRRRKSYVAADIISIHIPARRISWLSQLLCLVFKSVSSRECV